MYTGLYSEKRAAQTAAYFLHLGGGALELLKLTKLLYLAERKSYAKYGEPLTGDAASSLDHGPVLRATFDRTKAMAFPPASEWEAWMLPRSGNVLRLVAPIGNPSEQLGKLSRADLRVMDEVWQEVGHMTASQLRNYTHGLPEWTDPSGSSRPIKPAELFAALGYEADQVSERLEYLKDQGRLNSSNPHA